MSRIGLYEPLREGFRELNRMLSEDQANTRRHELEMARENRTAQVDQFNMEMQLAQEERAAQARQVLADGISEVGAIDPVGDRQRQIDQLVTNLDDWKEQRKGVTRDSWTNPKANLSLNQNIASAESEVVRLKEELESPLVLAREYNTLATRARELALRVAQHDPSMIAPLNQLAQSRMEQMNRLQQEHNIKLNTDATYRRLQNAERKLELDEAGQTLQRELAADANEVKKAIADEKNKTDRDIASMRQAKTSSIWKMAMKFDEQGNLIDSKLMEVPKSGTGKALDPEDVDTELEGQNYEWSEAVVDMDRIKNRASKNFVFKSLGTVADIIMPQRNQMNAIIAPDQNALYVKVMESVAERAAGAPKDFTTENGAALSTTAIASALIDEHNAAVLELLQIQSDPELDNTARAEMISVYEEAARKEFGYVPQTRINAPELME